jgi:hypothetical protein
MFVVKIIFPKKLWTIELIDSVYTVPLDWAKKRKATESVCEKMSWLDSAL